MCITNPADINLDGHVQLGDLLDLLLRTVIARQKSQRGNVVIVEHQGRDYETVQIGEQCWFAENLRVENYRNGDAIPSGLSNSEWNNATSGAISVYADSASNLEAYGRLFNWHAVDDGRGLCPSGWHVPPDGEWMTMEIALGMSVADANNEGYRGTNQGAQMKTTFGWSDGGNGTNSSGFSGLPGGLKEKTGPFDNGGMSGYWWTSSSNTFGNSPESWDRVLDYDKEIVVRSSSPISRCYSIRCLKD